MQAVRIGLILCFSLRLFAQGCVSFLGVEVSSFFNGSSITGVLHQPDGSYTAVTGTSSSPYKIQNVVPNYDQWIGSCLSPPTSLSLPSASVSPTAAGAASQVVAFGDFNGSGLPGAVFTATASPEPMVRVGVISGMFAGVTSYTVPAGAATVATADFNKDGQSGPGGGIHGEFHEHRPDAGSRGDPAGKGRRNIWRRGQLSRRHQRSACGYRGP